MSDDHGQPLRRRFVIPLDARDVLGATGLVLIVAGASAFHWGLALMAIGAACVGVAWRLSRDV